MHCNLVLNLISDYIEEEQPLEQRRQVDAHLRRCDTCRAVYEDLRQIVTETKALAMIEPHEGLWLKLRERVGKDLTIKQGRSTPFDFLKRRVDLWPFHKRLVLAASLGLIFILALSWGWRTAVKERATEEIAWAEIQQAEVHYQKAIYSLRQIVSNRQPSWDPQFTRVFEANLKKIDQAIAECQAAMKKYPRDPEAVKFLLAAYGQMVDFLQEALQIKS